MESEDSFEARKEKVEKIIKCYPDFPKKGVNFLDYFSILSNPEESLILNELMFEQITKYYEDKEERFNVVVGLESRGFLMGIVLAQHFKVPFVPIRKAGKLPGECLVQGYKTEYSDDRVEIQKDSVDENSNAIIVDDLLATGGTLKVACDLVKLADFL